MILLLIGTWLAGWVLFFVPLVRGTTGYQLFMATVFASALTLMVAGGLTL